MTRTTEGQLPPPLNLARRTLSVTVIPDAEKKALSWPFLLLAGLVWSTPDTSRQTAPCGPGGAWGAAAASMVAMTREEGFA